MQVFNLLHIHFCKMYLVGDFLLQSFNCKCLQFNQFMYMLCALGEAIDLATHLDYENN